MEMSGVGRVGWCGGAEEGSSSEERLLTSAPYNVRLANDVPNGGEADVVIRCWFVGSIPNSNLLHHQGQVELEPQNSGRGPLKLFHGEIQYLKAQLLKRKIWFYCLRDDAAQSKVGGSPDSL